MSTFREDLSDVIFTDAQAAAFHLSWDRLCLLLQEYTFKIQSIGDAEKRIVDHRIFEQKRKRKRYIIAFLFILIASARNTDVYVSVMDPHNDWTSNGGALFLVIALFLFALTRSRHTETYENFQNAEINLLKLQIRSIELEWFSVSGGLGLHAYKTDSDESYPLRHGPIRDPDFVNLKISIAQRCVRGGDYQLDPLLGRVSWVRA